MVGCYKPPSSKVIIEKTSLQAMGDGSSTISADVKEEILC